MRLKEQMIGFWNKGVANTSLSASMSVSLATFFTMFTFAQGGNFLSFFDATLINEKVNLNWTIEQGNTCNGIEIQRATDSVSFSPIGTVEGICGSISEPTSYSYTDESPVLNAVNTYRLSLGTNGFSKSVSVLVIAIPDEGYRVIPQPISASGRIHFPNDKGIFCQLTIYDADGRIIFVTHTDENYFELNVAAFTQGSYFFRISSEEEPSEIIGRVQFHP